MQNLRSCCKARRLRTSYIGISQYIRATLSDPSSRGQSRHLPNSSFCQLRLASDNSKPRTRTRGQRVTQGFPEPPQEGFSSDFLEENATHTEQKRADEGLRKERTVVKRPRIIFEKKTARGTRYLPPDQNAGMLHWPFLLSHGTEVQKRSPVLRFYPVLA